MRQFLAPALALLLLGFPANLAAQEEKYPWRISDFPYLMGDPTNGLLIIGHLQYAREADYDARIPYEGNIGLEAAWGTRGSRFLVAKFRAPGLLKGWRLAGDAGAVREGRFGYYGQGPEGEGSLANPGNADFFRVRRTRYYGRAEVSRQLRGPLYVVGAVGLAHYNYSPLDAGDAFLTDFPGGPLKGTDATGRVSVVVDTRNHELVPTKGLLLEAGLYAGSGRFESRAVPTGGGAPVTTLSDKGYTGVYAHFRGYVAPLRSTVLAGRFAVRSLGANAPLDARYQMPGWERDVTVYGGADSHRSFVRGRFVGRGVLFSSFELRHTLLDVGDYGAIFVVGFLDAGRAFEGTPDLTFKRWHVGGGGGLGLKVIRSALLSINFATGPDGFTFSMGNAWAF